MADDLRTRLLAKGLVKHFGLINPDGPEAVAALDERDERIKALEAVICKAFAHIDNQEAANELASLLTNPTPAKE